MKLPLVFLAVLGACSLPALDAQQQQQQPSMESSSLKPPATWPRDVTVEGVRLTVYQPQIDEWKDSRFLKARAAFVLTPGKGKPAIGVMEISGPTVTSLENRTVLIQNLSIDQVRFPSLPEAEVPATEALFRKTFPTRSFTVSLDRLVAGLEYQAKPLELKMDPPRIIVSHQLALLLLVEGKPVLAPIKGGSEEGQFIVNANWDLFYDPAGSAYYLLGGKNWYTAKALDAEWTLAGSLPAFLSKLPDDDQWNHVKKSLPLKIDRQQKVAQVIFSDQPAELIIVDGKPIWEKIAGLDWLRNTESWVFRDGKTLYFLTSGRWFSAPDWNGPWVYASNQLPEAFRQIPADSACGEVLASVPGTEEAADAIVLASIPREAIVKVKEAEAKANATYSGEPVFKPIEGTKMSYAANTSSDVIKVENLYYLCQNGVWFVAPTPKGAWTICTAVPPVIYTIPVTSPVHRVVYVTAAAGASPDVVVCSYTAGYEGAYVAGVATGAVLVWGTGYYYPPYVAWGGPVPVYYPWPATYGAAAVYNPYSGGYAVGARYYGPYGTTGSAAWYNPNTGNYGRATRVTSPYGASTYAAGYNPRTDTAWSTQQNYDGYSQWGSSTVQRGDDWLRTGHAVNENGAAFGWQSSEGSGHIWKGDEHSGGTARHDGDFYAGHDGNVYRRDEDGNWAKYDDGDWNSVDKPERDNLQSSSNKENRSSNRLSGENANQANRENLENRSQRASSEEISQRRDGTREGSPEQRQNRPQEANRATTSDAQQREEIRERAPRETSREQTREARPERTQRRERPTTREVPSDISRQLNRDATNRRTGAAREQRSFERRSSGSSLEGRGGGGRGGGGRERRGAGH